MPKPPTPVPLIPEDTVKGLFTHLTTQLRIADVDLRYEFCSSDDGSYLSVQADNSGNNRHRFLITVRDDARKLPLAELYEYACHEVVHILTWSYDDILETFKAYIPEVTMKAARETERRATEGIAYKLAPILVRFLPAPACLTPATKHRTVRTKQHVSASH